MESKIFFNLILIFNSSAGEFSDSFIPPRNRWRENSPTLAGLVLHHCHTAALLYITHLCGKFSANFNSPQNILLIYFNELNVIMLEWFVCVCMKMETIIERDYLENFHLLSNKFPQIFNSL